MNEQEAVKLLNENGISVRKCSKYGKNKVIKESKLPYNGKEGMSFLEAVERARFVFAKDLKILEGN